MYGFLLEILTWGVNRLYTQSDIVGDCWRCSTAVTITSHLFEAYLKCSTKCFFRSLGEADTGNAYANWVQTQTEAYRSEGLKRLMEGVPRLGGHPKPASHGHLKPGQ